MAGKDVGFSLETLARFYSEVEGRSQRALASVGGRNDQVDVPSLAAELVSPYEDEIEALAQLLVGKPLADSEVRTIVYDHAFACILQVLARHEQEAASQGQSRRFEASRIQFLS